MTIHRATGTDVRELPAYTISEAAHYMGVPRATARYWASGRHRAPALIDAAGQRPLRLSFLNLAELHVLAAIRRRHSLPMPKVRAAIDWLADHTKSASDKRHPLISKTLDTDGVDLFVEHYGRLVNISQNGQIAMRDVMSAALRRIERDLKGIPVRLYPFTRSSIDNAPTRIVMDPTLSAGRPVIAGTGLATDVIAERYKAGESILDLTQDYECEISDIEEAIRLELKIAA